MPPTTALHPQPLANPAPPIAMGLLLVVAITVLWDMGSGDLTVMRWIGTPQGFPLRSDWLLQAVLHDTLRQACTVLWGLLGAWALWPTAWTPRRSPAFALPRSERLWVLALVSASLLAVSLIKLRSQTSCPWDLDMFGGQARHVSHWHWAQADGGPGRCFPGGHASSGMGFLALCLPWLLPPPGAVRPARTGWRWLAAALATGVVAGAVQILRGAHYPSHTMWTLVICGAVSLLGWLVARQHIAGADGQNRSAVRV